MEFFFTKKSLVKFTRKSLIKIFQIFKLESDFFPLFLSKIRKLENWAKLFILNYNWANFQRNRRKKKSYKIFEIFRIFQLGIGFFSTFYEQNQKTRKYGKFKCSELYLSEVWARSEHLFFRKKRPLLEGVFEKKFQKFPNFPTWNRIFFQFSKKKFHFLLNTRNLFILNFIWANFQRKKRTFLDRSVGR